MSKNSEFRSQMIKEKENNEEKDKEKDKKKEKEKEKDINASIDQAASAFTDAVNDAIENPDIKFAALSYIEHARVSAHQGVVMEDMINNSEIEE